MSMRALLVFLSTTLLCLSGCATLGQGPLSSEQQTYWNSVSQSPVVFKVPKAQAEDVWGKAQSFIGKYSSMKLQIATDYVLQTYTPDCHQYGYNVTRTPEEDQVEFSVQSMTAVLPFMASRCVATQNTPKAQLNAHILAHYLRTGELARPDLIARSAR